MRNGLELYRGNRAFKTISEFDEIFDRAFTNPWALVEQMRTAPAATREWFETRTDVQETEDAYLLSVDLPGVRKEDLAIDVNGRTLTIAGERKSRTENSFAKYSRSFTLPESVDAEKIEANLEDGVLHVALPKASAAKPRSIEIGNSKPSFFTKLLGRDEAAPKAQTPSADESKG